MSIDQEKKLIAMMIAIYENDNHVDLTALKDYAFKRIEHCPRKEEKTFCSSCPIHCYQKVYQEQIRKVMKYSGKRILFKHPIIAIRHLINTLKYKLKS